MPRQKPRPILVCNIGWMTRYKGLQNQSDKIVGGGKFVAENGHGHECCNFLNTPHGSVYGHFETIKGKLDRQVRLERLGASGKADMLEHVDVVWVATQPEERGRRVVGYYLDATVYRRRETNRPYPTAQHRADKIGSYMVAALAENATLLPLDERNIGLGKGPGWIGQANWWFPETSSHPDVPAFLAKVKALIAADPGKSSLKKRRSGKWGGTSDPGRNALVEAAATSVVRKHFSRYVVESVEKDNRGWDLEIFSKSSTRKKPTPTLIIEVKGLSSSVLQVGVTPNEFDAFKSHKAGKLPHYRLCVVTEALSGNPTLHILRYLSPAKGWIDEHTNLAIDLKIEPKTAAIISLGN
jgi:hypothetical protein